MASRLLVFLIVVLFARPVVDTRARRWIVWNVGQGQWVTRAEGHACWHFDAGGEFAPWRAIQAECRGKLNLFTFSHWDWDHVSFAARATRALPGACVLLAPVGIATARKTALMARLPPCGRRAPFASWRDAGARTANAQSRVVWWDGVLVPGDSTLAEEKFWVRDFRRLRETRVLVLGHHGSRTSTSRLLLDGIPFLKAAVASARKRKYGHPHAAVQNELAARRVPLLRTEDWGTLIFED